MTPFKQMNGNFYRAYSFVTLKSYPLDLPSQILHLHTNGTVLLSHSDRNILHNTKRQKIKEKSAPKSNIFKIVGLIFPKF